MQCLSIWRDEIHYHFLQCQAEPVFWYIDLPCNLFLGVQITRNFLEPPRIFPLLQKGNAGFFGFWRARNQSKLRDRKGEITSYQCSWGGLQVQMKMKWLVSQLLHPLKKLIWFMTLWYIKQDDMHIWDIRKFIRLIRPTNPNHENHCLFPGHFW